MDVPYEDFDPFAESPDGDDCVVNDYLASRGWSEFLGIGDDSSWMRISTWQRTVDGRQEFLLSVSDLAQGSPFLKVRSFAEVMDLLARWAPVVQAAAVVSLLDDVQKPWLINEGIVEMVAAKASYGTEIVRPKMQAELAQQREQAARIRQERREARERAAREQVTE